jgi:hypothetical protein
MEGGELGGTLHVEPGWVHRSLVLAGIGHHEAVDLGPHLRVLRLRHRRGSSQPEGQHAHDSQPQLHSEPSFR